MMAANPGRVRLEVLPDGVNLFLTCGEPGCGQRDFYLALRFDGRDLPESAAWSERLFEMARFQGWLIEPQTRCLEHNPLRKLINDDFSYVDPGPDTLDPRQAYADFNMHLDD
jgi:hypothetical protein